MEKILVTGGAGDIGYWLARSYANAGAKVDIAENFERGRRDEAFAELLAAPNVTLYEGDLCERGFVGKLPLDYDYVFHLAAINGTDNFYARPFTVLESCTLPTILLLDHFKNAQLKRFVYAGSSEAYASTVSLFGWDVPTAESVPLCIDDPKNVRWSYGASKMHGEIACFAASAQYGIPVTVIRFHNVYGTRMGDRHVIPDFIKRAREGRYELYGATDTRTFIYVDDAVEACRLAAEAPGAVNEVINIGGDQEIEIMDLARLILKIMGRENEKILEHPSPRGSVRRRCPSLDKLYKCTGFKPKTILREGLARVIEAMGR